MQKHLEFQVVTPRTLQSFQGRTLVLPDVRALSSEENEWLKHFEQGGGRIIICGTDTTEVGESHNVVRFADDPGKSYNARMEKDFEHTSPEAEQSLLKALVGGDAVRLKAGPQGANSIARTSDGHVNVFFANFAGLVGGKNPEQTPQAGVEVTLTSKSQSRGFFLPFLLETQVVKGVQHGDSVTFTLPAITKGAVFWYEQ